MSPGTLSGASILPPGGEAADRPARRRSRRARARPRPVLVVRWQGSAPRKTPSHPPGACCSLDTKLALFGGRGPTGAGDHRRPWALRRRSGPGREPRGGVPGPGNAALVLQEQRPNGAQPTSGSGP